MNKNAQNIFIDSTIASWLRDFCIKLEILIYFGTRTTRDSLDLFFCQFFFDPVFKFLFISNLIGHCIVSRHLITICTLFSKRQTNLQTKKVWGNAMVKSISQSNFDTVNYFE